MRSRRALALLLVLALSFLPVAPALAAPGGSAYASAVRQQAASQAGTDAEINSVIDEAVSLEQQLNLDSGNLESQSEAANAVRAMLDDRKAEASRLASEAAEVQASLDDAQANLGELLRNYYVNGGNPDLQLIESLMQARGLDELIARTEYWQRLSEYRTDLVAQIREKQAELDAHRTRLAVLNGTLDLMQQQYASDVAGILSSMREEKLRHAALLKRLDQLHAQEMLQQQNYVRTVMASMDASSTDAVTRLRARVVAKALGQIGKSYVWGATGPDHFDCSGLMLYSYASVGVSIPRVSRAQYAATLKITRDQLQPGDLVFISDDGTPQTIHHVMMYIGDGYTVESPRTGDVVKIRPLSSRDQSTIAGYTSVFPPTPVP